MNLLTPEVILAAAGVAVGIIGIIDARRIRANSDRAFASILARAHTAIVLAKSVIKDPDVRKALDDALEGMKADRAEIEHRKR